MKLKLGLLEDHNDFSDVRNVHKGHHGGRVKNKLSNISKYWNKRWEIRKIVEYWYWHLFDANSGGDGGGGGRGGGGGEEESQGAGGGEKCRESSSAKNGYIIYEQLVFEVLYSNLFFIIIMWMSQDDIAMVIGMIVILTLTVATVLIKVKHYFVI